MARDNFFAALDVGSTRICCLIGRSADEEDIEVLAVGERASRGIAAGAVVELREATAAIAEAIQEAEHMADAEVSEVWIATSGGRPRSRRVSSHIPLSGSKVTQAEMHQVRLAAEAEADEDGRLPLLLLPLSYGVDDTRGIRNPEGLYGKRLSIDLAAVTAEQGTMHNVAAAVEAAHVGVRGILPSPYATGLALLDDYDRELGVTVIDMGGETTGVAVFTRDGLAFLDVLSKGGASVTDDIAYALCIPLREAEAVKTREANCFGDPLTEGDGFFLPDAGSGLPDEGHYIDRSYLTRVVTPRIEQTFERVRARLDETGACREAGRRVLLAGGASQMIGIARQGELILSRRVSGAALGPHIGIPASHHGPSYAAAAGLLVHASREGASTPLISPAFADGPNLFGRLRGWMRHIV